MSGTVQKIRANRKVLEQNCAICGRGFTLAEEVYQCSTCGGYHHVSCWDTTGACPQEGAKVASMPLAEPSLAEAPQAPAALEDAATRPMAAASDPTEAELQSTYAGWSTEELENALSVDRDSYSLKAIPLMEAEWKRRGQPPLKGCSSCYSFNKPTAAFCIHCGATLPVPPAPVPATLIPAVAATAATAPASTVSQSIPLAPDERRCPTCAEIIKKEAVKCRYCGHVFDSRYSVQESGGFFGDTGRRLEEDQIRADAKSALTMSLVGIFCFGIILGPIAVYKASRVLSQIGTAERQYPSIDIGSARGQAIAAIVIGVCVVLLSVAYILGRF